MTSEQLAELLAGIARAQTAIIDAMDRAEPGWKNTHLIPVLQVAANVRVPEPRFIDLPSRILLRNQGRAGLDVAAIKTDVERLLGTPAAAPAVAAPNAGADDALDFSKPA
jgi:hypothetical protein